MTKLNAGSSDNTYNDVVSQAKLMGSRGRARMYGRPEPSGRDYDYVVFTDDPQRQLTLMDQLRSLHASQGFKLRERPGGFLTASGNNSDVSVYPTAKEQAIHEAWALMEAGKSKDEAWDIVNAKTASNNVTLIAGHSGAGKTTLAQRLAAEQGVPLIKLDDDPAMREFITKYRLDDYAGEDAPARAEYLQMQRGVAQRGLDAASEGAIVEGTQLGAIPADVLMKYPNRILVDPDLDTIKRQRNARLQQKFLVKGKRWDEAVAAQKSRVTDILYRLHEPSLARLRQMDGTRRHLQVAAKTAAEHPALQRLLAAKRYSDRRDYQNKARILRELLAESPQDFYTDSEQSDTYGLTHRPTGFRIHAKRELVPAGLPYEISDTHDPGKGATAEPMKRYDVHRDGKNVAYLAYRPKSTEQDGPWVAGLHVRPEHRGSGLAAKLLQRLEANHRGQTIRLRARPYKDGAVDAESLLKMYAARGFTPYDPSEPSRLQKQVPVNKLGRLARLLAT